jgi:hypothetical protein
MVNADLVPFCRDERRATVLNYGKRSHVIDHARVHGVEGLMAMIGWSENPRQRERDQVKAAFLSSRWMGEREVAGQGHGAPLDEARAV